MSLHKSNWLKDQNARHQWHPMQPPKQVEAQPPLIIQSGDGVMIKDIDGRELIDCQGGLWCVNAGHGRSEIKAAIAKQLETLQYYTLFPGSTNIPSIELSAKLCEITAEEGIDKVFFSSGGSDSTESAFKIARQYWKLRGQADRYKFISLRNGYHGLHFGGMSACGGNAWKRSYEPLVPGFYQVEGPHLYRNPFTQDPEELSAICATLLEREIEAQAPDTVAAIIAEPIQGAGGVIVPPRSYWQSLRRIADKYDILLIADEVITGLGRSGSLFGCRGWGVKPDIMCMAKGITSGYLPLGATLLNKKVTQAWDADSPFAVFMQGYTYSGHPMACAAGIAAIELTLKEDLAGNADCVGTYFINKMHAELSGYKAVGDIRGKGLMAAIELVKDRTTKEPFTPTDAYPNLISDYCLENGLMLRCIVNKLIISPPLIFTKDHADQVVKILKNAFETHRNW